MVAHRKIPVSANRVHAHRFPSRCYPALDYAVQNHITLAGQYDINLALKSYEAFIGSLEFTSSTTYQAIGTAKPPVPPPSLLPKMGDDPVLEQDPALPQTAPVPAPGQRSAQRDNVTGLGTPQLAGAFISVGLVALVAGAVARHGSAVRSDIRNAARHRRGERGAAGRDT
jgi:hypothetical protein